MMSMRLPRVAKMRCGEVANPIRGTEKMSKDEREELMARTQAARAYTNQVNQDPGLEMAAFLAIFHPEMTEQQRREYILAAKTNR